MDILVEFRYRDEPALPETAMTLLERAYVQAVNTAVTFPGAESVTVWALEERVKAASAGHGMGIFRL